MFGWRTPTQLEREHDAPLRSDDGDAATVTGPELLGASRRAAVPTPAFVLSLARWPRKQVRVPGNVPLSIATGGIARIDPSIRPVAASR